MLQAASFNCSPLVKSGIIFTALRKFPIFIGRKIFILILYLSLGLRPRPIKSMSLRFHHFYHLPDHIPRTYCSWILLSFGVTISLLKIKRKLWLNRQRPRWLCMVEMDGKLRLKCSRRISCGGRWFLARRSCCRDATTLSNSRVTLELRL